MLARHTMDCLVCGRSDSLTVTYHLHGVTDDRGQQLVTVIDYRCEETGCSVPVEDLLDARAA